MAHTHDTLCLTIAAFLVRDNKVLLVNHPRYGKWLSIGGHIDPGEDTDETLFKEILEEAGLTKTDVRIYGEKPNVPGEKRSSLYTPAYVDRHQAADREHLAFVYFGEVLSSAEPKLSGEHTEIKWFSKEELESNPDLTKEIVWYASRALETK